MKVINVIGARPNFPKVVPIINAMNDDGIDHVLVHTCQHYDYEMSEVFLKELNCKPDYYLKIESNGINRITSIMTEFEKVCLKEKPNCVLVVGDVDSTFACAFVANKLGIKVVHIEAGLRSFDRTMPEEVNRVLTDSISDVLFASEQSALTNLALEHVVGEVRLVGNVMIDSLISKIDQIIDLNYLVDERISEYIVVTLHRPSNVDNKKYLTKIINMLEYLKDDDFVFPVHPRTENSLKTFGLWQRINNIYNIRIIKPLSYIRFLSLVYNSKAVLTDSGGIQEETTYLDIPCLTLRKNTERPITVDKGSNTLISINQLPDYMNLINNCNYKCAEKIPYWDGKTAQRICKILKELI